MNPVSSDLNLNTGQLAGIVLGVFLISSFSSILATLYILWYRRQRAVVTHGTLDSPSEAKRQMCWPTFGKLRGDTISPKRTANATTGQRQFPNEFLHKLRQGMSPQNHQKLPVNEIPFVSPVSPGSTSDQTYPVSPLSDKQRDNPGRDRSLGLGLGLFRNNTQRGSISETSDVPPIKFMLAKNATQYGAQQIQVIRVGGQETTSHRLLSNVRTTKTFFWHDKASDSAASREEADMRDSVNRNGEGGSGISTHS